MELKKINQILEKYKKVQKEMNERNEARITECYRLLGKMIAIKDMDPKYKIDYQEKFSEITNNLNGILKNDKKM